MAQLTRLRLPPGTGSGSPLLASKASTSRICRAREGILWAREARGRPRSSPMGREGGQALVAAALALAGIGAEAGPQPEAQRAAAAAHCQGVELPSAAARTTPSAAQSLPTTKPCAAMPWAPIACCPAAALHEAPLHPRLAARPWCLWLRRSTVTGRLPVSSTQAPGPSGQGALPRLSESRNAL
eukprot:252057-Rhodomonas_salina.1